MFTLRSPNDATDSDDILHFFINISSIIVFQVFLKSKQLFWQKIDKISVTSCKNIKNPNNHQLVNWNHN